MSGAAWPACPAPLSGLWDRRESSDVDPWTIYPHGRAYWQRQQILAGLRDLVRQ